MNFMDFVTFYDFIVRIFVSYVLCVEVADFIEGDGTVCSKDSNFEWLVYRDSWMALHIRDRKHFPFHNQI